VFNAFFVTVLLRNVLLDFRQQTQQNKKGDSFEKSFF